MLFRSGELQNGAELPVIDFNRDSVQEIERKITERGNRRLQTAKETLAPLNPVAPGSRVEWPTLGPFATDEAPQETLAPPCIWRTGCKHPDTCKSAGCCVPGDPDALRTDDDLLKPMKALAPCECLVRDKTPSAYHNVKCPRYVEGAL